MNWKMRSNFHITAGQNLINSRRMRERPTRKRKRKKEMYHAYLLPHRAFRTLLSIVPFRCALLWHLIVFCPSDLTRTRLRSGKRRNFFCIDFLIDFFDSCHKKVLLHTTIYYTGLNFLEAFMAKTFALSA